MNPNATRRTRPADRARRARPLAVALLALRVTGWLGILLGLGLVALDRTGLVERWLREELARRLTPIGSSAEFEDLRVDWLGPGVTLEGFRITQGGATHFTTERLYVALGLSPWKGISLSRLDLDGGGLRVSEHLQEDVRALLELRQEPGAEGPSRDLQLPSVQLRGFRIDADLPSGETYTLGSIDFSLESKPRRPARISGRIVLPRRPGAPSTPELYLHGVANLNGHVELFASAKDLAIEAWQLPPVSPFEELLALNPKGRFQLQSSARVDLRGDTPPDLELRVALEDAELQPPLVDAPVEALEFHVVAHFDHLAGSGVADPTAWSGGGTFTASWADQAFEGGLRLGSSSRPGTLAECWVHAPRLDVETPEILALAPRVPIIENLYRALTPSGLIDGSFGLTCRDDWRVGEPLLPRLEFSTRVVPVSMLRGAWHGWPLLLFPDEIPLGFPMPASSDEGAVYFARNARFPRRNLLDVDFRAIHPTGPAHVTYQSWSNRVDMPPFAPGYGKPEFDLFVIVPSIAIDERMRECMHGLRQVPKLDSLFDDYGLVEGRARAVLRVSARARLPQAAVEVVVDVEGVEAALADLPIAARGLHGRVVVRDGGSGEDSVSFDLQGQTASSRSIRVAGRQRRKTAEGAEGLRHAPRHLDLDVLELDVAGVEFKGVDVELLCQRLPGFADALEAFAPSGRGDSRLTRVRAGAATAAHTSIEVTPADGPVLRPRSFPMLSSGVRGRVLVEIDEPPIDSSGAEAEPALVEVSTRVAPLIAHWTGGVVVTLSAEFPHGANSRGTVLGAGFRPSDAELVRELAVALGAQDASLSTELDGLMLAGAVDVEYRFELPEEAERVTDSYSFFLRENDLGQPGGLELEQLAGVLGFEGEELSSHAVRAELDDTPLQLADLRISYDEGTLTATTRLSANAMALDREFLEQFLDDETVASLVDQFEFRGLLDVDAARVSLNRSRAGEFTVTLAGSGTLSDLFIRVGLPISIRSAQLDLEEFVISAGEARGWGRVRDLYGVVLDRDFSQASLLLSYYGSRFSVDTLDGSFCHGRIHGTSDHPDEPSSAPVFAVDLREPFAFQANVALEGVDLGLLLEDVFSSEIANRGLASGEARLQGKLANLLSITGRGWIDVRDSVLWSVPVLRDLFSQLGYDATAVFDDMSSEFRVEDGVVYMEEMKVHSPLLNLSGRGTLGLDGALHQDLQVKYSLVDKAGPLGSLIHLLQNTLLSVSIRGDMSRPRVFLRGALTGPFQNVDEDWRAIPSPGYSPLPERF